MDSLQNGSVSNSAVHGKEGMLFRSAMCALGDDYITYRRFRNRRTVDQVLRDQVQDARCKMS